MPFENILQQCNRLSSQKKFHEAIDIYSKWLQSAKMDSATKAECAIAYNNLGQLKYMQVDFDGAVKDYNTAISFDPKLSSPYYNRGTIMYRMGKFQMAYEDMKIACSLAPENEEFRIGLERTKDQLL